MLHHIPSASWSETFTVILFFDWLTRLGDRTNIAREEWACVTTPVLCLSLQRLVTSNGGQYYAREKSSFCRSNKGLKFLWIRVCNTFGRKKTWFRWKNNSQTYLCLQKWSTRSVSSNFHTEFEINPLESDFYHPTPLPSAISWAIDLSNPSKFPIPSMVGVWIFSGTIQCILKIVNTELFTQLGSIELHKDVCFQLFLGLFICQIGQQCDKISENTAESSWVNKLHVASR